MMVGYVNRFTQFMSLGTQFWLSQAAPSLKLPINSQFPPVAKVGEGYNFTFSEETFISGTGKIEYSISNTPGWIRLDSSSRTFSGTPSSDDVGTKAFQLLASDSTGTTSITVTLAISNSLFPKLKEGDNQLSRMITFQRPNGLFYHPSNSFNINFSRDTFQDAENTTHYYAVSEDNTPLPSWIEFNAEEMSFSGQTPVFTSPSELPQSFAISLIASNLPGFSQARASFVLTVENHILLFRKSLIIIDVNPGENISYEFLKDNLLLDGKTVTAADIRNVSVDQPKWIRVDAERLILNGVAPSDVGSSDFTLNVTDTTGDFATAFVSVRAPNNSRTADLILGEFDPIIVIAGEQFSYTFVRSDFVAGDVTVALDIGNISDWFQFDNRSLSLFGRAPANSEPGIRTLELKVSLGDVEQTRSLILRITQSSTTLSSYFSTISVATSSKYSSLPTPSSSGVTSDERSQFTAKRRRIILAVILPVFGLAALLAAVFIFLRRRRLTGPQKSESLHLGGTNFSSRAEDACQFLPTFRCISIRNLLPSPSSRSFRNSVRLGSANNVSQNASPEPLSLPVSAQRLFEVPQVSRFMLREDTASFHDILGINENTSARPDHATQGVNDANQNSKQVTKVTKLLPTARDNLQTATSACDASDLGKHHSMSSFLESNSSIGVSENRFAYPPVNQNLEGSAFDRISPSIENHQNSNFVEDRASVRLLRKNQASVSPQKTKAAEQDRFRGSTIREVSQSTSSQSCTSSERKTDPVNLGSVVIPRNSSQKSSVPRRQSSMSPGSVSKRNSWGLSSQLPQHLKQRRKSPQTSRFSNSSSYRRAHFSVDKHAVLSSSSESGLSGSEPSITDSQLFGNFPSPYRKTSKATVAQGSQMQGKFPFMRRSRSVQSQSSIATEELSISAIERQMEETINMARYNRIYGSQRRNSWHRLSALPETHRASGQEPEAKLVGGSMAKVEGGLSTMRGSAGIRAEVEEWGPGEDKSGTESDQGQLPALDQGAVFL